VRDDRELPLYDYRQKQGYQPVFGEGDPHAAIFFIGEAPGAEEAKTGRPFVGRAGRVLEDLLDRLGLDREDVYITNVVKDRPPENRDPTPIEVDAYTPFLRRQIDIIRPQAIATLGRFAMEFCLKEFGLPELGQKIGGLHGRVLKGEMRHGDVAIVPLYHPAAIFYNRELEDVLKSDFGTLAQFIPECKDG
jgi:DNA polymerase